MVHAAIYRSPYAHARIKGIDTSAAEQSPGVVAVYTGKDFEDLPALPCAWQAGGIDNFVNTPRPLEIDRVMHTGAGVAVVVAESRYAAEDALGLIEVDWEPLDTIVDLEAAVADGAPQLHENAPGNIVMDWECGDREATEAALAESEVVVRQRLVNQRLIGTPLETARSRGDLRAGDRRVHGLADLADAAHHAAADDRVRLRDPRDEDARDRAAGRRRRSARRSTSTTSTC